MPKVSFKDIQLTLLKQYGIAVQVSDDGTFDIKEKTGRGSGLTVRKRPIKVLAVSEPGGSVSRGPFNLQSAMHLSDADYKLVCSSAKQVLSETCRINKDLSFQKQDPNVIELCIDKLIEMHPELHAYDVHNRWGPRAFFKKLLRTSSGKANAIAKLEKDLAAVEAAVKEAEARNQPAGGEQAVVPQDAVAPGAAAPQQAATPAGMPAKKRGRPKKAKSPELESQLALDGAPAAPAPPVPNGAPAVPAPPMPNSAPVAPAPPVPNGAPGAPAPSAPDGAPATVAQPDPVVVAHPPPPVISEPSGPTPSAPAQPASPDQPAHTGTPTDPIQPGNVVPRDNMNDGEVINMDPREDSFNLDITMNSAIYDLSQLAIAKNADKEPAGELIECDDDDDDDDGGAFDMAMTMDKPAVKSAIEPPAKPTTEPATKPAIKLAVELTVKPTVESAVEPAAEPATISHSAPPASSASAPNPDPIAPDSSSPPSVTSSSTLVSASSSAPNLRVSLRKRTAKDNPTAPPAAPADPNSGTPKDDAASSAPPTGPKLTPTAPFMSTSVTVIDSDIMWQGILISTSEMSAIRLAAIQQAKGGKPMRLAPLFDDLIAEFVANPKYDPSSEPDPPFQPPAPVKSRRRGRVAPTATAAAAAVDPQIPTEAPAVAEQPKPKAAPKQKPKVKAAPEPESDPTSELEPEPVGSDPTTNNSTSDASNTDGMEVDTPVGGGPGGKKGKGRQQAAKGGAKAKGGVAATETKAPKVPKEPKVPAAPLRTSSRATRANRGTN
ncbi:hypothetical protein FRC07_001450 [Ceratobasidium sp. 392]|nr:hypothetical protein FRC07_001450 [Ceratobasidium sp. 392]